MVLIVLAVQSNSGTHQSMLQNDLTLDTLKQIKIYLLYLISSHFPGKRCQYLWIWHRVYHCSTRPFVSQRHQRAKPFPSLPGPNWLVLESFWKHSLPIVLFSLTSYFPVLKKSILFLHNFTVYFLLGNFRVTTVPFFNIFQSITFRRLEWTFQSTRFRLALRNTPKAWCNSSTCAILGKRPISFH